MLRTLLLPCCLFFVVIFSACTDDPVAEGPVLTGQWTIEQASRNGRATESLTGLYFIFGEDGSFTTNLTNDGNEATGKYQLEDQIIMTSDVPLPMELRIVSLTDSTLNVKANASNYRFDFKMRRIASPQQIS